MYGEITQYKRMLNYVIGYLAKLEGYLDDFSLRMSDYKNTRDGCINERTDRDYSHKLSNTAYHRNQGTPKVIGGGLLMLFAFLLMWGGNRTRRPKVREVQPTQPNKDTNQEVESIADELSKLVKLKRHGNFLCYHNSCGKVHIAEGDGMKQ
jgi:hypothetical protein